MAWCVKEDSSKPNKEPTESFLFFCERREAAAAAAAEENRLEKSVEFKKVDQFYRPNETTQQLIAQKKAAAVVF